MSRKSLNIFVFVCFITIGLLKFFSISYGKPYLLHPDEPYLYKDPLKLLYNYSHLDFSNSTNLFFWIVPIWLGIVFLVGLLTGSWAEFNDFKELLILEDFSIIYSCRILSIILSLWGSCFLWKVIQKTASDNKAKIFLLLGVLLNPFEIISNLWFKFDGACYFFSCFLLYQFYIFLTYRNTEKFKRYLYLLLFVAPAIRIDLVAFLLSFIIYDLTKNYDFNTGVFLKKYYKVFALGIFIYSLITLLPISFFIKETNDTVLVEKTFEKAISSGATTSIHNNPILNTIANNFYFYFIFCFILTLPVIAFFLIKHFKKINFRFLTLAIGIIILTLLIFGYNAPHYFLIISTILVFLFIVNFEKLFRSRTFLFLGLHVLCIASISIPFFWHIFTKEDTRSLARNYILNNTTKNDLIEMEGYINIGQAPPIDECPEVLLKRAEITKKLRLGTGESLILKAQKIDSSNCRKIIDISSPKRFMGTEYENLWNIPYDIAALRNLSPDLFVSSKDYLKMSKKANIFNSYINSEYSIDKIFEINFFDERVKLFLNKENYLLPVFIYRKHTN